MASSSLRRTRSYLYVVSYVHIRQFYFALETPPVYVTGRNGKS